jgi:putative endonuclease
MTDARETGARAETIAARHLEQHGYAILARNVRLRRGEIDILAREGGELVFVEVKARATPAFGSAAEAVTPAKQRSLGRAVLQYLRDEGLENQPVRVDVIAVFPGSETRAPTVEILPGAVDFDGVL